MKKPLFIMLGMLLLIASCDRKAFVKKLVGTWTLDKYLFDGQNNTTAFDTIYREWKLELDEDQVYKKTWINYYIYGDSLFLTDTLGYDTPNAVFLTVIDTFHFIDTIKTPRLELGKWELINSEEDLQLVNDSSNASEIYRILELKKSNLNLRKGNEEFYLNKQ